MQIFLILIQMLSILNYFKSFKTVFYYFKIKQSFLFHISITDKFGFFKN